MSSQQAAAHENQAIEVLLVEDEEAHLKLMCRAFESHEDDFHVTVARTLQAASEYLKHQRPDMAIIDWLLPDGRGVDLLPGSVERAVYPAVIMTSHGDEKLAVDTIKAGAMDYVVKSAASMADLPHIAQRVLRQWGQITERKRAEAALRQSEQRYQTLAEVSPIGIFHLDAAGRCRYVNDQWCKIAGMTRKKALGDGWVKSLHPEDRDRVFKEMKRAAGKSTLIQTEYRYKRHDGSITWVSGQARAERNTDGKIVGYVGTIADITERRHAEEELKQNEERLRNIIEHSTNLFYSHTTDHVLTYQSPQTRELLGCEPEEALVRWTDFVTDNPINQRGFEITQKAIDTGQRQPPYELEIIGVNGVKRWVEVNESPIVRDGRTVAIVGSLTDITERKRADALRSVLFQISEAARHTESLDHLYEFIHATLGQLIDTTNFYIALYNAENGLYSFPYFIDAHDKALNFTPMQLGKSLTDYVRRTGRPLFVDRKMHDELMASGEVDLVGTPSAQWLGVPLKTASGVLGVVAVQSYENPSLYSEEDLELLMFVSEQIALAIEHKQAETEVRKLSAAVEQSPISVVITDLTGKIEYVNPQFTRVTGYTFGEAKGQTPRLLNSGMQPPGFYEKLWQTITAGEIWRGTFQNRKKNGEIFWEDATIGCIKNSEGSITHYIAFKLDITEQVRIRQEKDKLEGQLLQAQKLETIGTLAGGIAHDFNNLLTPILGYADMAMNDLPPKSQVRKDLGQIVNAALRAKDLVKQILTFSRQTGVELKPLRIHLLVKETLKLLRATLPSTIKISTKIDATCAPIMADATQIHQILLNLCTNASYAMSDNGGVLEISLREVEAEEDAHIRANPNLARRTYVLLRVKDSGCGMTEETRKRIFEPFFTTKGPGAGTGLGMSVVHGIVESHGGAIYVESEVGRGTEVCVYLPALDAGMGALEDENIGEMRGDEVIMVVDDEEVVAAVVCRMLERLGYTVALSHGSRQALAEFAMNPQRFDLLVTDQTMPDMTGVKLAEEIHRLRPGLPIILMSGIHERLSREALSDLGIRDYVMKPINFSELGCSVRRVLDDVKVS